MSEVVKCDHCHLEFDHSVMIKEKLPDLDTTHYFCCKGCQGVFHLLQNDGLESFYDKKGKKTLGQPVAFGEDSGNFDMESFQKKYIKTTQEGFSSVDLIIEGIHCAACIWLNEKVLAQTDGVVEANINFTNNKAKIVWDEESIKLSTIIQKIRSIGYNAYPYERTEVEKKATKENQDYFLRMSIAIFASMNIMMIGVAKYTGFFTGMDEEMLRMVHMAEFIFATPVLFYSGWVFYKGAYYGLKNKMVTMDLLVSAGASLTYIYSLYVLFGGAGHSYFDSVAMIITFVLVGKYLEVIGKKGAMDTMDTIKAQIPLEATLIRDQNKVVVPVENILIGDIVEVKHGEKASVDGKLLDYETSFDESSITGESLPVYKKQDDDIYSGCINVGEVIRYQATKSYADSTLNCIVELLEDSLNSRPKIQETTNKLSQYFSVFILAAAFFTFLGWYLFIDTFETALIVGISVIIIACPCALALATPIASLVGISWLAKQGLLFKEAKFIETFATADTVVLDKTGTITTGNLEVKNMVGTLQTKEEQNLLYTLADSSTHPVSKAIKNYMQTHYEDLQRVELDKIQQLLGMGMQAYYNGTVVFGGKDKQNNLTTNYSFSIDNKTIISFELEDTLKEKVYETINYLKKNNIKVFLCSGDNETTVKKIADEVGIEFYQANMTPQNKSQFIAKLQEQKHTVVMVGDGINDSLALSQANIAIAMGNGADVALAVSDVVVLNDNIDSLSKAFYISKRTFKFIKQNLAISMIYNIVTIPIAMAGYVIPLVAALSMSLSSLLVVGNSARIKQGKIDG